MNCVKMYIHLSYEKKGGRAHPPFLSKVEEIFDLVCFLCQVVFRAKVGESYQLPHKGIIPRELGVVFP
jgi:hypothetical protein